MDKKSMSEQDIRTKFITPAIAQAGWDIQKQVREEFSFTKGRIIVRSQAACARTGLAGQPTVCCRYMAVTVPKSVFI